MIALLAGWYRRFAATLGLPVALAAAAVAAMRGRALAGCGPWPSWPSSPCPTSHPNSIVLPAIRAHRDDRIGIDLSANTPDIPSAVALAVHRPRLYAQSLWDPLLGRLRGRRRARGRPASALPLARLLGRAAPSRWTRSSITTPGSSQRPRRRRPSWSSPTPGATSCCSPSCCLARSPREAGQGLRWRSSRCFSRPWLIGALPAIVAIPLRDYELTLLAPLGVLGLLGIGSAAARAQEQWPAWQAAGLGWAARARLALLGPPGSWSRRGTLRAISVAVAILTPSFLLARHLEAEHRRWDSGERSPVTVVLADRRPRPPGYASGTRA